jgi:glycosyltransferase involved in cell wall biosynthesis
MGFLRDLLFLLPARLVGCTRILHFHSRDFRDFYAGETRVMRRAIKMALGGDVHVIVLGESRRNDFGELIHPERVHVVPNGVPDVGCGPPAETRPRVVVHLAALLREKGVFSVLEVARALRDIPDVQFVLAGEWSREHERQEAMDYIAEHGLGDMVRYVGMVSGDPKAALLQNAAVMLFPSTYKFEGHPLVLLEALSAGTPIVASRFAAIPEIVSDGEVGFLVESHDVAGMALRVESLLLDGKLRACMSLAARQRYEDSFTESEFSRRLGAVWRFVTDERVQEPETRSELLA